MATSANYDSDDSATSPRRVAAMTRGIVQDRACAQCGASLPRSSVLGLRLHQQTCVPKEHQQIIGLPSHTPSRTTSRRSRHDVSSSVRVCEECGCAGCPGDDCLALIPPPAAKRINLSNGALNADATNNPVDAAQQMDGDTENEGGPSVEGSGVSSGLTTVPMVHVGLPTSGAATTMVLPTATPVLTSTVVSGAGPTASSPSSNAAAFAVTTATSSIADTSVSSVGSSGGVGVGMGGAGVNIAHVAQSAETRKAAMEASRRYTNNFEYLRECFAPRNCPPSASGGAGAGAGADAGATKGGSGVQVGAATTIEDVVSQGVSNEKAVKVTAKYRAIINEAQQLAVLLSRGDAKGSVAGPRTESGAGSGPAVRHSEQRDDVAVDVAVDDDGAGESHSFDCRKVEMDPADVVLAPFGKPNFTLI